MKVFSSAFSNNQLIPIEYTCDGEGKQPPLSFENIPKETISLALTMHDPDVPSYIRSDKNWDHMIVWNILPQPPFQENGMLRGIYGKTTSNTNAYVPPCPPDKEHKYIFKLYALDVILDLDKETNRIILEKEIDGHIIDQAKFIGRYVRK